MKNVIIISFFAGVLALGAGAASARDNHRHGHRLGHQHDAHRHDGHRIAHHHGRHNRGVVYGTYTKNILVKTTQYRVVPIRYNLVAHTVMVRPARRIAHRAPAVTQRVAETIMIQPARRVWTHYRDAQGNRGGCWKDLPARYGTRYRTVLVRPASIYYSVIPAEYRTVTRKVRAHY